MAHRPPIWQLKWRAERAEAAERFHSANVAQRHAVLINSTYTYTVNSDPVAAAVEAYRIIFML